MNLKKNRQKLKQHSLQDIQSMIACFEDDILPIIPSKVEILLRAKQRRLKKKILGSSVLTLCTILCGLYWYNPAYQKQNFMTRLGEQRNIQLGDGSNITLNTNTYIQVEGRLRSREIILHKGEASFHIKHFENKFFKQFERSFQVTAGNLFIVDIGTVFNVQRNTNTDSTVTVLEGEITAGIVNKKNTMVYLTKGQSLSNQNYVLLGPIQTNLDIVTAWQNGHVIFNKTSLESAIQNFQRYTDFDVTMNNSELNNIKISGQFKTSNYQEFMEVLPYISPVSVVTDSNKNWEIRKK